MHDEIFAGVSFPDGYDGDSLLSIFVNGREVVVTRLGKDNAAELHRRINRIPREEAPRCVVCGATAGDASPPGLHKDGTGAWICIKRQDCIGRMQKPIEPYQASETIQVVMIEPIQQLFRNWLRVNGLRIYRIPSSEDDLPTYGVGF
jgi:hypothetical protein